MNIILQNDIRFKFQADQWLKSLNIPIILIASRAILNKNKLRQPENFKTIIVTENFSLQNLICIIQDIMTVGPQTSQSPTIVTLDELLVPVAGELRDYFKIPEYGFDGSLPFFDKVEMKKRLSKSDIKIPKFYEFSREQFEKLSSNDLKKITAEIGLPLFAKPTRLAGSMYAAKIENLLELRIWVNKLPKGLSFELDEYIQGKLFHCDSVLERNGVFNHVVSEYSFPNAEFLKGKNLGSFLLGPDSVLATSIAALSEKVIKQLKGMPGVYHTEIFDAEGKGLVFLETAMRPAGGMIVEMVEKGVGIHLQKVHLELQLGLDPVVEPMIKQYPVFWMWISKMKGKVKSLQLPRIQSAYDHYWRVTPGEILKNPTSVVDRSGGFLCTHDNRDVLRDDFIWMRDSYRGLEMDLS